MNKENVYIKWLEINHIPKEEGMMYKKELKETLSYAVFVWEEACKELWASMLPQN